MTVVAYYNEFDPKAAAWLRQLIKNGNITPGEVDERSITEVDAIDLIGFDRCHFFAGIGTWDYCLNESGWGDKPIWTASLPCQPFSAAGKGLGKEDERHLLPHFLELVKECRPTTIIGEQVAAAIGHGWLDDLYAEMEACDYAIASAVIGAHSVGAPHIRQRLYWVGVSNSTRPQPGVETTKTARYGSAFEPASSVIGMGDTEHDGRIASEKPGSTVQTSEKRGQEGQDISIQFAGASRPQSATDIPGCEERQGIEWLYCRDNKYRPIKPGIQPLVDGTTGRVVHSGDPGSPINANEAQEARVMRLKGYGNAIQARTAVAFISAYMAI